MVASGTYVVKEEGLHFEHRQRRQQRAEPVIGGGSSTNGGVNNSDTVDDNDDNNNNDDDDDTPTTPEVFLEQFRKKFTIRVLERIDANHLVLELINVDVSFVNALRRILLSEIPTVALEHIYMWNNNSVIHDEILSHRIGLIPLNIDARFLDDIDVADGENNIDGNGNTTTTTTSTSNPSPTDRNTVVFRLSVSCTKQDAKRENDLKKHNNNNNFSSSETKDNDNNDSSLLRDEMEVCVVDDPELQEIARSAMVDNAKDRSSTTTTAGGGGGGGGIGTSSSSGTTGTNKKFQYPKDRPYTKHVYSRDLKWIPQGLQKDMFPDGLKPIHDDIIIAKLRPGQSIELEAHGQRGIGRDHAKYSPVCTASYRLMPYIEICKPIYDNDAYELITLYEPNGVFGIQPIDPMIDKVGTTVKAFVQNPYSCTMSRNYMRNPILAESIVMKRISNHFIFSIESVGMYSPSILFAEAIRVLQRKCTDIMDHIEEHNTILYQS